MPTLGFDDCFYADTCEVTVCTVTPINKNPCPTDPSILTFQSRCLLITERALNTRFSLLNFWIYNTLSLTTVKSYQSPESCRQGPHPLQPHFFLFCSSCGALWPHQPAHCSSGLGMSYLALPRDRCPCCSLLQQRSYHGLFHCWLLLILNASAYLLSPQRKSPDYPWVSYM